MEAEKQDFEMPVTQFNGYVQREINFHRDALKVSLTLQEKLKKEAARFLEDHENCPDTTYRHKKASMEMAGFKIAHLKQELEDLETHPWGDY